MNVICASLDFPSLGWKWESSLPLVHVYCKVLWETKYREDYEMICNKLFPTLYQVLFGEEAPCLSPEGQAIVKEYEDLYMIPISDTNWSLYQDIRKHQASALVNSICT